MQSFKLFRTSRLAGGFRLYKKAHCFHSALDLLAARKGLEPSASGVTGRRYNRLNYRSGYGGQYRT